MEIKMSGLIKSLTRIDKGWPKINNEKEIYLSEERYGQTTVVIVILVN